MMSVNGLFFKILEIIRANLALILEIDTCSCVKDNSPDMQDFWARSSRKSSDLARPSDHLGSGTFLDTQQTISADRICEGCRSGRERTDSRGGAAIIYAR